MKLTVPNPLNSEKITVSEFTMNDMRDVAFMIENDSDLALHDSLLTKLKGTGDCVTKFITLFKAREQFIGDTITLHNGSSNINIQLSFWFDEILKQLIDIKRVISIEDFKITVDYPSELLHEKYDDILVDMIQDIEVGKEYVNFNDISHADKLDIVQKLPYNVVREIQNYIKNTQFEIVILKERLGLPNMSISFFDNSAFNFIKLLFNYYRYDEIMDTVFAISTRISDIGFLMSRNPKDIELLIKLYSEEVEKMNSEDKSIHE